MPRPTDQRIIDRVVEATKLGHPIDTAGQLAGLGHDVARRWLVKGLQQLEDGDELGSHAAYAAAIKDAEAEMVDLQLHHVARDAANKGGWTAAMTLLERRRPRDFGRNVQVEQHSTLTVTHTLPEAPERALLELVRDALPALPPAPTIEPDGPSTD